MLLEKAEENGTLNSELMETVEQYTGDYLDKATMDMCYNVLKPGHKPCFIDDLFKLFTDKGFLMFSKEQLLSAIDEDDRFCVEHTDSVSTTEIYVLPSTA